MTAATTLLFGGFLVAAALEDVRTRRIPNGLVVALATTGLLISALGYGDARTLKDGILGIAVGLVLWVPFFGLGWLGAGDVKLFAASGAWLAPGTTLIAAVVAALVGGLVSLVWMLRLYGSRGTTDRVALGVTFGPAAFGGTLDPRSARAIPYGVSLAIGAFAAPWVSDLMNGVQHAVR